MDLDKANNENELNNWQNIPLASNLDSDLINSILRQKLLNNLLLIDNVLDRIKARKNIHQELINEIITIENLIMVQLRIINFRLQHKMYFPESLKGVLEREYFTTKREKIRINENSTRDIAMLEKELRELWKNVFELLTQIKFVSDGLGYNKGK